MKGDVIFSEFLIVIKTYTDVKKTLQFSIFWPDTNNSYKNISALYPPPPPPSRDMLNKFKHFLLLLSEKEIWNNTEKWTSPALRSLQKYQAISKMTIAAATDPPM